MTKFDFFSDSEPMTTDEANFLGLWVHEPSDPESTVKQYLYGKDLRSTSVEIESKEQFFAGRKYPVTDFGEHQEESFSITVHVPFGPTFYRDRQYLIDLVNSRQVVFIRDSRGRGVYGTFKELGESDEDFGAVMDFDVIRANREVEQVD